MNDYGEILKYMGHRGAVDARLKALIVSSLEKLAPECAPHHVTMQFPCAAAGDCVTIGELNITSKSLAAHLCNCTQAFVFAATLGAAVDRLIAQRVKIDSAEGLCLQACAAVQIEDYCNGIEQGLAHEIKEQGLYLCPRFSPGYGDFDITHQTGILNILQAHKRIGLTETNAHMLTPLKSVTAVIGAAPEKMTHAPSDKCAGCSKTDCSFVRMA